MTTRDVLCHVRALYPYESNDASSLCFKENAVIEVLAQLESGWWDGRYEGKRGWFPSNYVEIIHQKRPETKNHLRLSLHLKDNWILQTTEDGSEQYYFNPRTNEMRYSIPPEGYIADEEGSFPPVRPARAANRLTESFEENRLLPPDWIRKMTPEGRYYYSNLKTEETTWELENIDPDTGLLISSQPNSPPRSPTTLDTPITWPVLSSMISNAIFNLKESTHDPLATTRVVQCIRLMLYVSNCLDKDSVHLKSNKQLRSHHRSLLAALAKLVLSAKLADPKRLLQDADETLVCARRWMSYSQELLIPLKERYRPQLEKSVWRNPLQLTLRHHFEGTDPSTTLLVLAENLRGAIHSLRESVKATFEPWRQTRDLKSTLNKLKVDCPLLVAQFRNLSNTASRWMNAVDQIESVIKAKHPIYEAMGKLFVLLQQATRKMDGEEAEDAFERMMRSMEVIEQGVDDVVVLCQEEIKNVKAPLTPLPSNTPTSQVPWFLVADVDPDMIVLSAEGTVKGGTLHGLVQRLTQHDQFDAKFNVTFLLTYRSFCTTEEMFNELFQRYQLSPPEELNAEEIAVWNEQKLKLIRLRVFNVIKSWLETYFNEEEDRPILATLSQFTDQVIIQSMKFGAEQLSKLIKKRMLSEDSGQIRKMKLNVRTQDMPEPILPKNLKRIKLLELDPLELARQMTMMDFKLYNRIKPVECLDKNWGKPEQEGHIAANVRASIEHSNQVTAWVTDSILSKEEAKKRATVLKFWIGVADRSRQLNNFNTCMAILSAFDNGSIGRLRRTWELISGRSMQILASIRRLMGSNRNFSEYREIIHRVNPPCIPFLGIYLQDLTFIEDGNSNFLKKSNRLISFAKRMKTASVIQELQQYQSMHYMLTVVPDIQEFIKTHLQSSRDEEELYNLSLRLEPRERGEDTIARRLKESGL